MSENLPELTPSALLAIEEFAIDAKYEDCMRTFVETTLTDAKIAQMFEISSSTLEAWKKEYSWAQLKDEYRRKTSGYVVRKNTVKRILDHSSNIAEQLNIVGNFMLQDAFEKMQDDPSALSIKDRMAFAIKVKELEAKVTGQIQTSNTTNIINSNTIYKKLSDEGIEGFYGAEVMQSNSIEVLPTIVERPKYSKEDADKA
jgi:hypothetical protein